MKYSDSNIWIGDKEVLQVNISTARKHHENQFSVFIFPCDAALDCGWVSTEKIPHDTDFDSFVEKYKESKCNYIVGKRPIFFIYKKEIEKWKIINR